MSNLNDDLAELRRLKVLMKSLKKQYDTAARQHSEWESQCFDRMVSEGYEPGRDPGRSTAKFDGVVFSPYAKEFATVQNLEEFLEWAREHDEALVVSKALEGELNRLVRSKLDNGEGLPPGLGFHTKQRISIRGAASTREDDDD